MESIISVENVSKRFKLYYDRPLSLKERIVRGSKGVYKEFYALSGISFEVKKGSTVGLLGQNGSGKSTLLKIINRTMFPEEGKVTVRGKVASLIELGAGFHPELSGRENIYTNATVFGITKSEIERRIPEIIRFSELEEFIDNPVRTYSSGMYARLAFSVAINVDADVLLVDEILGVGDMNFQAKCASKIYEMRKKGTTIVVVTHDMGTIDRLCDYAVWLDHGIKKAEGNPKEIEEKYMAYMAECQEERTKKEKTKYDIQTDISNEKKNNEEKVLESEESQNKKQEPGFRFENFKLLNDRGSDKRSFQTGEKVCLVFSYSNSEKDILPNFGIKIKNELGELVYGTNTIREGKKSITLKDKGIIEYTFPELNLVSGVYTIDIGVTDESEGVRYNSYNDVVRFKMFSPINDIGMVRIPHVLMVDGNEV